MLIKGKIHQEEIIVINIYAPNASASNFIKEILLNIKAQIKYNTIIVSEFYTPNIHIDKIDIAGIYRIFHSTAAEYTFFSEAYGTFSITGTFLAHKAILNKYKKIEITSCILSNNYRIILEINSKLNHRKYLNKWIINNTQLNDQHQR
jgi:hypothetical protein